MLLVFLLTTSFALDILKPHYDHSLERRGIKIALNPQDEPPVAASLTSELKGWWRCACRMLVHAALVGWMVPQALIFQSPHFPSAVHAEQTQNATTNRPATNLLSFHP